MKSRVAIDGRRSSPSKRDGQTNAECRPADQRKDRTTSRHFLRSDEGHEGGEEQKERIQRDEVIIWKRNVPIGIGCIPTGNGPGKNGANSQRDDDGHDQMTDIARLLLRPRFRGAHDKLVVARGGEGGKRQAGLEKGTFWRGGNALGIGARSFDFVPLRGTALRMTEVLKSL